MRRGGIEFFLSQTKPLDLFRDSGPFFCEKFLTLTLEQQITGAGVDEHPEASLRFDQLFTGQFLVSLQNRERIDAILGRDIAHGRQRIAFFEHTVEYHGDDTVAELAVNWLTVMKLMVHPVFQMPLGKKCEEWLRLRAAFHEVM
jgi:hypothetical protein